MSVYLARIARLSFRHRRAVLGFWLLIVFAVVALSVIAGGKTVDDFSVPGTQAQRAVSELHARIPAAGGGSTQVVFVTRDGSPITGTADKAEVEKAIAGIRKLPQVSTVVDPYQTHGVSADGQAALVNVQYFASAKDVKTSTLDGLKSTVRAAQSAGLQVEFEGAVYPGSAVTASELPEIIGIAVGLLILLVTFGAFVSAGLPLLTAIFGVAITITGILAVASIVNVASAATSLAIMLALACGVDYAVFILFRHRNNMLIGLSAEDSIALAAGTAGSSVVFAASTVIVALASLSVVGIPFLTVMGLTASAAVLIALLIALTLLPALLGFAGDKVVSFLRIGGMRSRLLRTARRSALEPEQSFGAKWARFVVRRKYFLIVGGIAALLAMAIPALSLQLGLPSGVNSPSSSTAHKAYDLTTRHFGVGANGPLTVVVDTEHATAPNAVSVIATSLSREPDVASATVGVSENHTSVVMVTPKTGPDDKKTSSLVKAIRRDNTSLESQTGTSILVGGVTAANIDTSQKLSNALPTFLIVVVALAFLLLTLAFRTLLVPLKSVIGFLLSVLAAFGAEVAVFQWGWLKSALHIQTGQTLSFLPIILLAVIFGLSSDYEVFVASRIKEEFTRTRDASAAVSRGTAQSARVVTTAALIMFSVFLCFLLFNTDSTIKAIGFTLAVGVLVDAFVVRLMLVPAVMAVIGQRFWYHPRWFARTVPDLDIEGEKLAHLMTHLHHHSERVPVSTEA